MAEQLVCVVDDDPLVRKALCRTLRQVAGSVRPFSSAEALWAELETLRPDLIVSDYNMPGMDGFELLTRVRDRLPHTRTIMLTGSSVSEEIRGEVGGRIDRLLIKPWRDDALRAVVRELLSGPVDE